MLLDCRAPPASRVSARVGAFGAFGASFFSFFSLLFFTPPSHDTEKLPN
jgi:hypothetical protein